MTSEKKSLWKSLKSFRLSSPRESWYKKILIIFIIWARTTLKHHKIVWNFIFYLPSDKCASSLHPSIWQKVKQSCNIDVGSLKLALLWQYPSWIYWINSIIQWDSNWYFMSTKLLLSLWKWVYIIKLPR